MHAVDSRSTQHYDPTSQRLKVGLDELPDELPESVQDYGDLRTFSNVLSEKSRLSHNPYQDTLCFKNDKCCLSRYQRRPISSRQALCPGISKIPGEVGIGTNREVLSCGNPHWNAAWCLANDAGDAQGCHVKEAESSRAYFRASGLCAKHPYHEVFIRWSGVEPFLGLI